MHVNPLVSLRKKARLCKSSAWLRRHPIGGFAVQILVPHGPLCSVSFVKKNFIKGSQHHSCISDCDLKPSHNMNANRTSKMLQEASFGPSATNKFDFTLGFENIILSILPSALFLIIAPQRLFLLKKQSRKVAKSSRSVLKFVRPIDYLA